MSNQIRKVMSLEVAAHGEYVLWEHRFKIGVDSGEHTHTIAELTHTDLETGKKNRVFLSRDGHFSTVEEAKKVLKMKGQSNG